MKITHLKILAWLEIENRRIVKRLDSMILESRYTTREYHFLERGLRVP